MILERWQVSKKHFVKVMPVDYKRAIEELRKVSQAEQTLAREEESKKTQRA
jgi:glutamate synthase domain-containing protein 3